MNKTVRETYKEAFEAIRPPEDLIAKTVAHSKTRPTPTKQAKWRGLSTMPPAIVAACLAVLCVFGLATHPSSIAEAKNLRLSSPVITLSGPNSLEIDTYEDRAAIYVESDFSCENSLGKPYRIKTDNNIMIVSGKGSFSSEWSNELVIKPDASPIGTIRITVPLSKEDKKELEENTDSDDAITRVLFSCLMELKKTTLTLENEAGTTVYIMAIPEFSSWKDLRNLTSIDAVLTEKPPKPSE